MNYKNTVFSMFFAFAIGGTSLSLAMMELKEEPSMSTSRSITGDELLAMFEPLSVVVPQASNNHSSKDKQRKIKQVNNEKQVNKDQKKSIKKNQQQKMSNQKQDVQKSKQHVNQTSQTKNKKSLNVLEKKQLSDKQSEGSFKGPREIDTFFDAFLLPSAPQQPVNARDGDGKTPLHHAAKNGLLNRVKSLVEDGADVNAQDSYDSFFTCAESKRTALHYAVQNGHTEVVKFLMGKGADIKFRDTQGNGLLHYATTSLDDNTEMVNFVIEQDPTSVNDKNIHLGTPLHGAAVMGKQSTISILLEKGADVNARNVKNRAPMYYASRFEDIKKLLVKNGADGDNSSSESFTTKMKNSTDTLWSSIVKKNKQVSMKMIKKSEPSQQMIQPKLANRFSLNVKPLFSCSQDNNWKFPSIHYRSLDGQLKSLPADIQSNNCLSIVSNQLSKLKYKCPKMNIPGEVEHQFPITIEQNFGHQACVFIETQKYNKIISGKKKLRLYITLMGKMDNEPGVFEFYVEKSLYEKKGKCYHRFFNPKGSLGAQAFGAKEQKK